MTLPSILADWTHTLPDNKSEEDACENVTNDKESQPTSSTDLIQAVAPDDILERIYSCHITTLIITNIPHRIQVEDLRTCLENTGFGTAYDFLYMPHFFHMRTNCGYAFINLENHEEAARLFAAWNGADHFKNPRRDHPLMVNIAHLQGMQRLLQWCVRKRLYRFRNPSFRPFVRDPAAALPVAL
mmetsp:Transcript_51168/g.121614  ORF Transcript_51168/g.121614 Transcript_51168/m.121614 type:complete len:185 (+) Transcript_51168:149-703(+)